jgi:hypothetical protein
MLQGEMQAQSMPTMAMVPSLENNSHFRIALLGEFVIVTLC